MIKDKHAWQTCSRVWLESVVGVHCSPYFRKRIGCSGEEAPRLRIGTGVVANYSSESTLGKSAECFPMKGDYRQDCSWVPIGGALQIPIIRRGTEGCD
ncbi:hypothetical protein CEXT_618611 [Caerostris extrusa]|uniref:Uncharacterized protein n=1 Tax=Caerostris extrusa TaxID=172846 RepID=A0AAV4PY78_CAEEX|nr:hypothetical protein CEXT_618611 [Caerostris extrusa]